MVDLAIFVIKGVMMKSGHGGSMGGGLGNCCDGRSYAKIDRGGSLSSRIRNRYDGSNYS